MIWRLCELLNQTSVNIGVTSWQLFIKNKALGDPYK